jgi:hypothetical protein
VGVVAADVTAFSPMKLNFCYLLHSSLPSLNGGGGMERWRSSNGSTLVV